MHIKLKKHKKLDMKKLLLLSLASLGIVYGDIGTSPLYAINEIFFGHARSAIISGDILGIISIVFWALTLTVAFKYVVLVLRADSDGEGGVFALFSLIHGSKIVNRFTKTLGILLVVAAGLLLGDGMITPAISVVSAVEGLKVATSTFTPYIVPITIIILTGLFFIQQFGTHKIGSLFGPIITVWFVAIGIIGGYHLFQNVTILSAINPLYALDFFMRHELHTIFLVLGSVMLVLTGGEAMYADMGHFGSKPIRVSWFSIVYPALLLNYFGQGAYMLSGKAVIAENIFYSMVPQGFLIPMVLLATLATIIASQALISGAFSLISQASSLGLLPYMPTKHTNKDHHGQIYIPSVNWLLYIGCVTLVLLFQSSNRLASAYGLAVSGVMLVTTISMIAISHYVWKWNILKSVSLFIPFALLDLLFLSANSLKLIEGGFIPLGIGVVVLVLIKVWQWGRKHVTKEYDSYQTGTIHGLMKLKENSTLPEIERSFIFMVAKKVTQETGIPTLLQVFIDRYGFLPKHIIFLTVEIIKFPHVRSKDRYEIINFGKVGAQYDSVASVVLRFGYMEEPNVEKRLEELAEHHEIQINTDRHKWIIEVMHERIYKDETKGVLPKIRSELYKLMARFADPADVYFHLGKHQPLSVEVMPVKLK